MCIYIYMIIIYTWILLIVEISTPKPKSINFAKFKRKRAPERLFPLQNVFFSLQNASERFWMFFFHASWTRFSTKGTSDMSRTAKTTTPVFLCVLFPHQASKSIFYWGSQKKSVLGSSRCIYIYIFYNTILYIYIFIPTMIRMDMNFFASYGETKIINQYNGCHVYRQPWWRHGFIFLSQDITCSLDDLIDIGIDTKTQWGLTNFFTGWWFFDTARLGGMAGITWITCHWVAFEKNMFLRAIKTCKNNDYFKKNLRFPWRKNGRCTRITFGETKTWQNPWGIPSPTQDHHAGPSRAVEACPRFSASSAGAPSCPKTQKIRPAFLIVSEICWVQGGKETSQLGVPTYNLWFCPDDGADYAVKIRWSTSKHGYRLVSVASQIHKLQKKNLFSFIWGFTRF